VWQGLLSGSTFSVSGLGGFVASVRSGELAGAFIEPGTSIDDCIAALGDFLEPETLLALSRSSGVAKARFTPDVEYSEADRDELVSIFADEPILRMAYCLEQKAALLICAKRLFGLQPEEYVSAAIQQAVSEATPIPVSPEVGRHALLALAKAAQTEGEASQDLIELFTRAVVLTSDMIRLADEALR
jgi:hypothetical protein